MAADFSTETVVDEQQQFFQSIMSRLLSHVLTFTRVFAEQVTQNTPRIQTLFPKGPTSSYVPGSLSNSWIFNIVRENHYGNFKAKESIRVKRLGFYAKVKTRKGRKLIMRRILKGRFVLTH